MQERGLYFADNWDAHYETPLAMHDPGEPAAEGGLLWARHGKGTFVYTGLAFFRQLPAGVPGAFRLFANLLRPAGANECRMTGAARTRTGRDGGRAALPHLARDLR